MSGENIFIVEDERIVAEDLKRMLERLSYKVVGSASSGDEALRKMELAKPDLVLMDIRIQGALDGIDVAEHVVTQFDIPVVYLTAYADETTVDRAKGTLPAGYILKPFEEVSLKTTIELALYRHNMDRIVVSVDGWHGGILESLNVAVIATDADGTISFMNRLAEDLTGQVFVKSLGKPLKAVFQLTGSNGSGLPSRLLATLEGRQVAIDCKASPIKDAEGKVLGTSFLLTEVRPQPYQLPTSK